MLHICDVLEFFFFFSLIVPSCPQPPLGAKAHRTTASPIGFVDSSKVPGLFLGPVSDYSLAPANHTQQSPLASHYPPSS